MVEVRDIIIELAKTCIGKSIHQVDEEIFKRHNYDVVFHDNRTRNYNDYLFTIILYYDDDNSKIITEFETIHNDNCWDDGDFGLF